MKTNIFILFLIVGIISINSSCSTEESTSLPDLITIDSGLITEASAVSGGIISSVRGSSVTACGVCWSTTPNPTLLDSITLDSVSSGRFLSKISGLKQSTTYFVRAYATNKAGTAYGLQVMFTTKSLTLTTTAPTTIMTQSAISGGTVLSDGDSVSIIARGVCWSTSTNPTVSLPTKTVNGKGLGQFSSKIIGLLANTTYYVRAYATNLVCTTYGDEYNFSTAQLVADLDGNLYNTESIGTQVWLVENLNTTKYRDGTSIPNVKDATQWSNLTTGAYLDYNNTVSNSTTYGRLYNWYAVCDSRNIAPSGWHVATHAEWEKLISFLGGWTAGGKLKESGTIHWLSPNTGATNESGFTALPGGYYANGGFYGIGESVLWWDSTRDGWDFSDWPGYYWNTNYDDDCIYPFYCDKINGFSVRCLRDN